MSVVQSPAWKELQAHAAAVKSRSLADLVLRDPERIAKCNLAFGGLRLNYAFQNVGEDTVALLMKLAEQQQVESWRARMFLGDRINITERRAVLHTVLRREGDEPVKVDGINAIPEVRATQARVAAFVNAVRSGQWTGATGLPVKTVVNIGIGGSDLGPRMAALALKPFIKGLDCRFVANVDAFELTQTLAGLDPEQTLFVIVSKTFTTQETLLNARSARKWLVSALGEEAVAKHFVAVSTSRAQVESFGIQADNMFPMWDWVGGRTSLWSAVGLTLALGIGNEAFADLLRGAAAMDEHFKTAPLAENLPVLLGMLGVWNRNFMGSPALAVLPYCERLRELPRYLQQLEMESNGKSVTRSGEKVDYDTVPALFGDCGTVGQHSFHQWLHQGTTVLPADFIVVAEDPEGEPEHHKALVSNAVAQMGALAFGQKQAVLPQDVYQGGRPSNLIMLDKLDPYRLGLLLALYEHKVFVQGIVWEINSYDQPGVELGKRMAKGLTAGEETTAATAPVAAFMKAFFRTIVG